MDFTNEILEDMNVKKTRYNIKYSNWYYGMSKEFLDLNSKYEKRSERIANCLNLWQWDKYEKNKLLDLQSVNRCNNNRFCPNCKLLDISKFIHKFRDVYSEYSNLGYKAYMLTLTVPSVDGIFLKDTLEKLSKTFLSLMRKYTYDLNDKRSYPDRLVKFDGGIKVLEITYNENKGFHPHYHCVLFVRDSIPKHILEKNIRGKFSNKINDYTYKSFLDLQIGQLWSMLWHGDRLNKKNINNIIFDPKEIFYLPGKKVLEVDFRELDESGIYEVFKYTFKDTHIKNYYVFKTLVQALENKRIRQGFGILFNMQCEDIDEGEIQELSLIEKENPVSLVTYEINELITTYRSYRKISRFNRQIDNNIK